MGLSQKNPPIAKQKQHTGAISQGLEKVIQERQVALRTSRVKSLHCALKDRKGAWDLCRAWEKAAESAGRGSLTEVQARKVLNEILEAIGEGPVRDVSVREFFLNWLTGKQLSKKETTGRRYKKAIEEFVDSLGPKADKSIVALTPADVEHFRDVRTKQGVSATTVKLDLKLFRSVLNTARRHALILHSRAGIGSFRN